IVEGSRGNPLTAMSAYCSESAAGRAGVAQPIIVIVLNLKVTELKPPSPHVLEAIRNAPTLSNHPSSRICGCDHDRAACVSKVDSVILLKVRHTSDNTLLTRDAKGIHTPALEGLAGDSVVVNLNYSVPPLGRLNSVF